MSSSDFSTGQVGAGRVGGVSNPSLKETRRVGNPTHLDHGRPGGRAEWLGRETGHNGLKDEMGKRRRGGGTPPLRENSHQPLATDH